MPDGTPPAVEFHRCIRKYADDLLEEVERLEVAQRSGGGSAAEFTSSMVTDADRLLRRAYRRPTRPSKGEIAWRICVALALVGVGVATNNLDEWWGLVLFVASIGVSLTGTILDLVGERS
ncbi:hypothetical protein GCM10010977_22080 [Citricoccus zhacaiensis]|uniref:DUF3040 domain-containing protein n=1 Tax=Citricoccus zhacaiensis TaxID=489142 RepID=A0ABQ2M432_9MICC|nr:hypothetical protein GCM10010977_22080 [Citricoccus zhacaiensis]